MKDQDQEKFVTVSVSGSVDAVAEAISRIFGATVNPDALEATDADGNFLSKFDVECRYNYTDEDGNILYRVTRLKNKKSGTKSFTTEVAGPDGRFRYGRIERKVPYNLPKLMEAAKNGGEVAVCNGERAAEAHDAKHEKSGIIATTFHGGLPSSNAQYAEYFKGVGMVLIVDDGVEPTEDGFGLAKFVKALKEMGIAVDYVLEAEAGVE